MIIPAYFVDGELRERPLITKSRVANVRHTSFPPALTQTVRRKPHSAPEFLFGVERGGDLYFSGDAGLNAMASCCLMISLHCSLADKMISDVASAGRRRSLASNASWFGIGNLSSEWALTLIYVL